MDLCKTIYGLTKLSHLQHETEINLRTASEIGPASRREKGPAKRTHVRREVSA